MPRNKSVLLTLNFCFSYCFFTSSSSSSTSSSSSWWLSLVILADLVQLSLADGFHWFQPCSAYFPAASWARSSNPQVQEARPTIRDPSSLHTLGFPMGLGASSYKNGMASAGVSLVLVMTQANPYVLPNGKDG